MTPESTLRAQLAEARDLASWALDLLLASDKRDTVGVQAGREAVAGWVGEKATSEAEKGSL